ncbi:MAG: large conductance mechanosensitive channel protein MscL [Clostridia bacterium]|nr:large conductance mechanosensitive channel protein MscL [Clostridia bacterium]
MSKTKGFISEFKAFITKGNVIDLAVGVIIGGAFQAIVKSLVDDIVMPVISLLTKGVDFATKFIALDGGEYATLEAAQEAGAAVLTYGNFISAVINFLIMAFVIFLFIKFINKLNTLKNKEEVAEEAPATKVCEFCKSEIAIDATRCPHCTSEL